MKMNWKRLIVAALFAALVWAPAATGQDDGKKDGKAFTLPQVKPGQNVLKPQDADPLCVLYKEAVKGVVCVEAGDKVGSGFLIGRNGAVVTNYHLIAGATKGRVTIYDGTKDGAKRDILGVLGYDASQDLAVLLADVAGLELYPLQLSDAPPEVGKQAAVLGSPLCSCGPLADGAVLNVCSGKDLGLPAAAAQWLRIDAPIFGGSTGGPLLGLDGKVVGVVTRAVVAKAGSSAPGGGFAAGSGKLQELIFGPATSTTPTPLETVAEKEKGKAGGPGGDPAALDGPEGWMPRNRFSRNEVGDLAMRARSSLACSRCSGDGKIKITTYDSYFDGMFTRYKARERLATCPDCAGSGKGWGANTYGVLTRLVEGFELLDAKTCSAEERERLRKTAGEALGAAALDRRTVAALANDSAAKSLTDPRAALGKPVLLFGAFVSRVQQGKSAFCVLRLYNSNQYVFVQTAAPVSALEGQYFLAAGLCLGPVVCPVEGGAAGLPAIRATAFEPVH